MSKRIDWIDVTKGLAIILVVVGHTVPINSRIFNLIFSFHMPIFFIISGYLFKIRDPNQVLKRNFKRIIVPYVSTCFLIIIGTSLILYFENMGISQVIKNIKLLSIASVYGSGLDISSPFFIPKIGAIWFLLALFFADYFFAIIIKYTKKRVRWQVTIILILAIAGYLISKIIWLPFSLNAALIALFYLYIGYVSRKLNLFERKFNVFILIAMASLWGVSYHVHGVIMANGTYPYFPLTLIGSVCGSYFVIKLCQQICKLIFLKNIFSYLGVETLIILSFHLIEKYMVPYYLIQNRLNPNELFLNTTIIIIIKLLLLSFIAVHAKKLYLIRKLYYAK